MANTFGFNSFIFVHFEFEVLVMQARDVNKMNWADSQVKAHGSNMV